MFQKIKSLFNKIISHLPIIVVTLTSFSLRFINLGYSDYQGDEIKSFFILEPGQTIAEFLLNQRKGPGQFFITLLVKQINPSYENEFATRFLFALAGSLAVVFFYKFTNDNFNKKVAFYSSMFFATNGFFVALSRISQYQPFVILFMVLSIYMMSLTEKGSVSSQKGILLSFLFWSFAILFHYDGIFIAPLMLYFLFKWLTKDGEKISLKNNKTRELLKALILPGILLSIFYIPFVINISQNTLAYWGGRITGEVSAKLSSSRYLFTVYQPIYVVHFYTLLFILGVCYFCMTFVKLVLSRYSITDKIPNFEFDGSMTSAIFTWFLISLIFFEVFVYIPGTHIYNYLLPMFIFLALGIVLIEKLIHKLKDFLLPSVISYTGLFVLFTFLYAQSYAIFVDHAKEYPWEPEKFLVWDFPQPTPIFHLSMFGFPYFRNWEGISNVILNSENNGFYSTNERKSIARFFVPFDKSTDRAGHFIHIINPQSFTNDIQQEKAVYWSERYPPIFTYSKSGKDLVRVYYMEPGTLEEIKEKGF